MLKENRLAQNVGVKMGNIKRFVLNIEYSNHVQNAGQFTGIIIKHVLIIKWAHHALSVDHIEETIRKFVLNIKFGINKERLTYGIRTTKIC